ncbi:MAG: hypothetical protein IT442_07860 [Phycisphaeraceae bacterium]|nr:hypothetical protein [Phycisphaeraceae bacterium]
MTQRDWTKVLTMLVLLLGVGAARADQPASAGQGDLAAENARLRSRVAELEAEVARLRAENQQLRVIAGAQTPTDRVEAQKQQILPLAPQAEQGRTAAAPVVMGQGRLATSFVTLERDKGVRAKHWVRLIFPDVKSGAARGPATMTITNSFSTGLYQGMPSLTLTIDGQQVSLPVADYHSERRGGGGPREARPLYDEVVQVTIEPDLLERIAHARRVELQLRQAKFLLTPDGQALFLAATDLMNSTPAPAQP